MSLERDAARLFDLLADDPSLARDLLRWTTSAKAVGPNGAFVAYREQHASAEEMQALIPRRIYGQPEKNRLYHADNLAVLRSLLDDGLSVRCVYIDPPYGTQQQFARKTTAHPAYCDAMSGAAYLSALRARLVLLRELLDPEGSMIVHLDASMVAEVKLLLDELFGASNFRAWITRRKCSSKNYTRKTFGDISDYVLFYSKTARYVFNRQFEKRTPEQEAIDFPKVDQATGRRFALVPLHAPGRRNGLSGSVWRGMLPPPGKHWQWTPEKLDECEAKGDIYWTRNGTPRRKIWADESAGSSVANIWSDFRDPFNQNFATTGYPTEKNVDLLKRLISATSDPGDLVLDCYAGSGTTLAAASALERSWVGIDSGALAVALTQRRLAHEALAPDLLKGPSAGFEVWGSVNATTSVPTSTEDIEFALVEAVNDSSGIAEVREILTANQVPERMKSLRKGERIIAFDHGGNEMNYEGSASIHSREKRPAWAIAKVVTSARPSPPRSISA